MCTLLLNIFLIHISSLYLICYFLPSKKSISYKNLYISIGCKWLVFTKRLLAGIGWWYCINHSWHFILDLIVYPLTLLENLSTTHKIRILLFLKLPRFYTICQCLLVLWKRILEWQQKGYIHTCFSCAWITKLIYSFVFVTSLCFSPNTDSWIKTAWADEGQ